jgi:hypothetical protein
MSARTHAVVPFAEVPGSRLANAWKPEEIEMNASEEAPPTAESTSVQTPSLLASARDITFVLAIIAFFVGFEYRYYYYDHDLHVPSSVFPFVDNKILAGSYSVFIDHAGSILKVICVILLVTIALDVAKIPRRAWAYKYQRIALFSIVLASFPILNIWAQQTASKVAFAFTHPPAPQAPLILTFQKGKWNHALMTAISERCVAFITESSDTIYALVRQKVDPIRYVVAIPVSAVDHWIVPLDYSKGYHAKRCIP